MELLNLLNKLDGRNELSGRISSGTRLFELIIIIELCTFVKKLAASEPQLLADK